MQLTVIAFEKWAEDYDPVEFQIIPTSISSSANAEIIVVRVHIYLH